MAGNYDPLHDVALLLAAISQTAGGQARVVSDPLQRLGSRLGFDHRTDPAVIEDKLRGNVERRVRRQAAREIIHLDQEDRARRARNVGPYGDMQTSLNRLMRGQALPALRELRGGEGAEHD